MTGFGQNYPKGLLITMANPFLTFNPDVDIKEIPRYTNVWLSVNPLVSALYGVGGPIAPSPALAPIAAGGPPPPPYGVMPIPSAESFEMLSSAPSSLAAPPPTRPPRFPKLRRETVGDATPKAVHVFIGDGSCFDHAGNIQPFPDQVRFVVTPSVFESLSNPILQQVVALIRKGASPAVDLSCCSWIDTSELSESVNQFLEFVMSQNGTVRFSDFSLRVAKSFLQRMGMPVDYTLTPDLEGSVEFGFNAEKLSTCPYEDLQLLAQMAPGGKAVIRAMTATRRISLSGKLPDYAEVLMTLHKPGASAPDPGLITVKRGLGRVVLFSCHFCETSNIQDVDPERVACVIRAKQGEDAAREFLERVEQTRLVAQRSGQPVDCAIRAMASGEAGKVLCMATPSGGT